MSLHCPLTDETRAMIDDAVLAQATPGLIFVNTARGALVESLDLVESALRDGRLAAAGLDVLPQDAVIHDERETHAYECDALTAY